MSAEVHRAESLGVIAIRRMIAEYWQIEGDEQESHRAESAPLADVVRKLLTDLKAFEAMYLEAAHRNEPLHAEISRLRDDIADMRRPMTAQMEMQNRRIVALTAELDRLRNGEGRP